MNWDDIKPQQTPAGLYVAQVHFVSESVNSQMLSALYTQGRCPHFLAYYQSLGPEDQLTYILVQHSDMTLPSRYVTGVARPSTIVETGYMIQVLVALRAMQTTYRMMHNDLFLYSVTLNYLNATTRWNGNDLITPEYWAYPSHDGKKRFYIPRTPMIVKISELGFSSSFIVPGGIVRSDIYIGGLQESGMPSEYHPQCDVMTFLLDFYHSYSCECARKCIDFIAKSFDYESASTMCDDILILGESYRIRTDKLPRLNAAFLLDNVDKFCSADAVQTAIPDNYIVMEK
jgi:hypothetical protein